MKNILVIGGTRNMGYAFTKELVAAGHRVTILNRGIQGDDLGHSVSRLHVDRTDITQMRRALLAKPFDVVVDFVLYNAQEAQNIVDLLKNNVGHYIALSSGQVYLVRENIERPFTEDQYEGRLLPAPKLNTYAYEEWRYGMDKRGAEDVLAKAYADFQFPYTALRLPMVNSARDPLKRLYSYILRLRDGGPILLPETPNHPLRHIYAGDAVRALMLVMDKHEQTKGRAFNFSQEETVNIDEFLKLLAGLLGVKANLRRFKHSELEANGFLPDCSPFSDRWMSEITNDVSKSELGMTYTPLPEYLETLVAAYDAGKHAVPVGYRRRHAEVQFAESQQPIQGS
jgi:nucleoside-diphosphate-sugar epimerase